MSDFLEVASRKLEFMFAGKTFTTVMPMRDLERLVKRSIVRPYLQAPYGQGKGSNCNFLRRAYAKSF